MEVTCVWHARRSPASLPLAVGRAFCTSAHADKSKETKMKDFETWLQGMGHNSCNLRLCSFPPASATPGLGTKAGTGGIGKGEVVVQVPLQAFMSEQTARACPHVGSVIQSAGLTAWQGLCLHLLYEKARGIGSMWHPYLALLPSEPEMVELHPLMWPQGMCQEWLAGSPMLLTMEQRLRNCKEDYEVMLAAAANGLLPLEPKKNLVVTEVSTRWAASILLSRAFSLDLNMPEMDEDYDNRNTVLVPWADLLNHSSSAGKDCCWIMALWIMRIRITELICREAAYLGPVRDIANDALLKAIGLPSDGAILSITEAGVDDSALAWTRAAVASAKELASAGWSGETQSDEETSNMAASAMASFHQPVSQENESEVLRRLLSACGKVLTRYSTAVDEDVETSTNKDWV
ncbi:hypothetical protein GOP47_0019534 [Adiantum capillus-veneris]|uniref:Rubisco LSMT substrate-binding domain-containing protein n=1 Tax=Adiantum capillus-veneris TaxID=13818 RepID=A0A9D4Z7W8_ADICA|nr:hypothetical protein GOP47_0019534 [Adiantum capillus-veneris]